MNELGDRLGAASRKTQIDGAPPREPTREHEPPRAANENSAFDETLAAEPGELAELVSSVRAQEKRAAAPARLGRYVVLGELGAGGMGIVYAAYDPELDRKVAIKLIRAGRGGAEERTRLVREARAMAKLSHAHVVAVHDVGTLADEVFVTMEFVAGQTLGGWLSATARGWREIVDIFVQAGRGLAAAHAAGLIHRDFKPESGPSPPETSVRS